MNGLRFGPINAPALHVCIDMQRLFAEPGEWHTPALMAIVPAVTAIVERHLENTVFTRFITPYSPDQAPGAWQRYYRRWRSVTREFLDPVMLDLVAPLQAYVPPAQIIDKTTHSAFESENFNALIRRVNPGALVFTGVETDVCVLASLLTAVDRGFRVIVVEDAVTSSSPQGHRATLEAVLPRFDQQIETVTVEELLAGWPGLPRE